jgi:hypothetical protein
MMAGNKAAILVCLQREGKKTVRRKVGDREDTGKERKERKIEKKKIGNQEPAHSLQLLFSLTPNQKGALVFPRKERETKRKGKERERQHKERVEGSFSTHLGGRKDF